jgi:hypothetical protein
MRMEEMQERYPMATHVNLRYTLRGSLDAGGESLRSHPADDGYNANPSGQLAKFGLVPTCRQVSPATAGLGSLEAGPATAPIYVRPPAAEMEHLVSCKVARLLARAVLLALLAANRMQRADDIIAYLAAVKRRLNNGRDNGALYARCVNMLDAHLTDFMLAGRRVFADHADLPKTFRDKYHPGSGAADISEHCAVNSPFLQISTGLMASAYVTAAAGFENDSREHDLSPDVQEALLLTAQVLLELSDRLET